MIAAPNSLVAQAEIQDRIAADWLLNFDAYRVEFAQSTENILNERATNATGIRGSVPGDDTANRGRALMAADRQKTEKWIAVIEQTEKALPTHLQVFLKLRREYRSRRGPNGWVPMVQIRFATIMAQRTGGNETETYRSASRLSDYWDEIVNYTVRQALAEGIFTSKRREIQ